MENRFAGFRDDQAYRSLMVIGYRQDVSKSVSRKAAIRLWETSVSPEGTMGIDYVKVLGALHEGRSLRFNMACTLAGASPGLKVPAILFPYRDKERRLAGVERHLLDPDTGVLISHDFVGDASSGFWLTGGIRQTLEYPFGRLCVAHGVARALEVSGKTGCVCAAVWDMGLLKTLNPPKGVHEICADAKGMDSRHLKSIRSTLRGRAYLFSTITERYPPSKQQSLNAFSNGN